MLTANTRIIPIKKENRVKTVQKLENGDLSVELHGGTKFCISKDDDLFQAFIVYTVLADL